MIDSKLRDIESMARSPDSRERIGSIVQLENHLEDFDHASIMRILTPLLRDADRTVVEQARRLQGLVDSREEILGGPGGDFTVFQQVPEPIYREFTKTRGESLDELRAACYDLLANLILKVHAHLVTDTTGPIEIFIDSLGHLKLSQSVPVLLKIAQDHVFQSKAVEALTHYRTRQAEETLLAIAQDPRSPAAGEALAGMGRADPAWALDKLTPFVTDPDASRRRGAAVGLGQIRDPGSEELLRRLLGDPDEGVVLAAIKSLSRLGAVSVLAHLRKLATSSDSAKLRSAIASALQKIQTEESKDVLQRLLGDPDPRARANALESLSYYQLEPRDVAQIFVPLLRDETPRIRGNAIVGIYRYRAAQATEALTQLFNSGDRKYRRAAAWCASRIQSPEVAHALITMILTEQDPDVLTSGLKYLGEFARRDSVEIFMRMTRHPRDEVRTIAMQVLGRIGGPAQLGAINSLLKQEMSPKVRSAAVSAIAKLAGPNSMSMLPRFLHDTEPRVVANTIQGLYQAGNLEAISYVKPMLMHASPRVQGNAIVALFCLGDLTAVNELPRLLDSTNPKMASSGAWALKAIGDELRLKVVTERFLLKLALKDHYRKVVKAESSSTSMSRFQGIDLSTGNKFEFPSGVHGEEAISRSIKALKLPEPAEEDLKKLSQELEVGSIEAPIPAGVPGQPPPPEPEPPEVLEEGDDPQARGLRWESLLRRSREAPDQAAEMIEQTLAMSPRDPLALMLGLRMIPAENTEDRVTFITERLLPSDTDFLELLLETARELKSLGRLEESLRLYLKIYKIQYWMLGNAVEVGEATEGENQVTFLSSVIRLLSSQQGLAQGLERELGEFYFQEGRYDDAFELLYKVRMLDPADSIVALKIAFICRRQHLFRLCKRILKAVVAQEEPDSKAYRRALRIYQSLKSPTRKVRATRSIQLDPEAPPPDDASRDGDESKG